MNGIENITKRISDEAEKNATQIIARAREEARAICEEYTQRSEEMKNSLTERGEKSAKEREERLRGTHDLEARKAMLGKKQELISRAFDMAVNKLESSEGDERAGILATLALRAANGGEGEIILPAADKAKLGAKILAKCAENKNITISDETREISGGLILRDGSAEVNCTFRTLVNELRDELSREVADILFG